MEFFIGFYTNWYSWENNEQSMHWYDAIEKRYDEQQNVVDKWTCQGLNWKENVFCYVIAGCYHQQTTIRLLWSKKEMMNNKTYSMNGCVEVYIEEYSFGIWNDDIDRKYNTV